MSGETKRPSDGFFSEGEKRRTPHAVALGMKFNGVGERWASLKLRYAPHLIGNPETGVLHGGCITALLDQTCGMAIGVSIARGTPMVTVDLRIDYLRPARPGEDVIARAECTKVTGTIAFVRALAYESDPEDPVATATGTFMINTRSEPFVAPAERVS